MIEICIKIDFSTIGRGFLWGDPWSDLSRGWGSVMMNPLARPWLSLRCFMSYSSSSSLVSGP